jgi:hypothetical protein
MPMVEHLKVRVVTEYEIAATTETIGVAVQAAVEMAEGREPQAHDDVRLRRRRVLSADVVR